jgi:hypothetical protein
MYTLLEGGREAVSRRRATPAPPLESFLEFDLRGPTMRHRAEAILIEFRNFCGPLYFGSPLKAHELADYRERSAQAGAAIPDLRLRAQILIGVDELWRRLPEKHGRQRVAADDWTDISPLLDDYECKSVYDFTGVAFFDAHQTWGERAFKNRRARAAFLKDCEL